MMNQCWLECLTIHIQRPHYCFMRGFWLSDNILALQEVQKICVGSYPFFSPLSQEFLRYQWETSQVKSMLVYPTIVSSVSHRWQQSAEFDSTSTGGTEKEAFLGPLLRGVWLARTLGSTLLRPQRRSSQCYFLSVHSFINSYIHWSL